MKIVVVGGGSTYTPELVDGIGRLRDTLPVHELVLVDPAPHRLVLGARARGRPPAPPPPRARGRSRRADPGPPRAPRRTADSHVTRAGARRGRRGAAAAPG